MEFHNSIYEGDADLIPASVPSQLKLIETSLPSVGNDSCTVLRRIEEEPESVERDLFESANSSIVGPLVENLFLRNGLDHGHKRLILDICKLLAENERLKIHLPEVLFRRLRSLNKLQPTLMRFLHLCEESNPQSILLATCRVCHGYPLLSSEQRRSPSTAVRSGQASMWLYKNICYDCASKMKPILPTVCFNCNQNAATCSALPGACIPPSLLDGNNGRLQSAYVGPNTCTFIAQPLLTKVPPHPDEVYVNSLCYVCLEMQK